MTFLHNAEEHDPIWSECKACRTSDPMEEGRFRHLFSHQHFGGLVVATRSQFARPRRSQSQTRKRPSSTASFPKNTQILQFQIYLCVLERCYFMHSIVQCNNLKSKTERPRAPSSRHRCPAEHDFCACERGCPATTRPGQPRKPTLGPWRMPYFNELQELSIWTTIPGNTFQVGNPDRTGMAVSICSYRLT